MSLAINNNVTSLTAQHNLARTSASLSQSLERLSSGLKINRGADGPAALVISEQERAQISGLQAAIGNSSKAVSLVQTAEGALNEINSLLVKVRGLAVDSANTGVNDTNTLTANQTEIRNALDTINRIAGNTQFGTKKLLDGSLGQTDTRTNVADASDVESQETSGLSNVNLATGDYKLKITQKFIAASPAVKSTNTSGFAVSAGLATDFFNDTSGGGVGSNDINVNAVTANSYFKSSGTIIVGNTFYAFDNTKKVSDALTALNGNVNRNYDVTLANNQFTVTARTAGVAGDGGKINLIEGASQANTTATTGGLDAVVQQNATAELVDNTGASLATPILLASKAGSDGTVVKNSTYNVQFDLTSSFASSNAGTVSAAIYHVAKSGSSAVFQVGANAGQTASISIDNVQATALGTGALNYLNQADQFASLDALDVTVANGASDALSVVDKAISQISQLRGRLGAFQENSLQSNANNLQTTLENTTNAESVIRDTDFAAETANFSKNQVLLQAGTTVLANANQIPQLVLALLK